MKNQIDRVLLNEKEAADLLQCSVHKLRAERGRRTGCPFVKMGRRVVYRSEDLTRHINDHLVKTV